MRSDSATKSVAASSGFFAPRGSIDLEELNERCLETCEGGGEPDMGERSFNQVGKGILNTPPLNIQGESPVFLSMLRHRDLISYLIAIKSLYLRVGHGRVVIINEQSLKNKHSLTSDDLALLNHHVRGIVVVDLATISTGCCPRGGTWERLVKIVELSASNYVIQADADTLVSAPIPEVIQCWKENCSFLMDGGAHQHVAGSTNGSHDSGLD